MRDLNSLGAIVRGMRAAAESGACSFDFGDIYTGVEESVGHFVHHWTVELARRLLESVSAHSPTINQNSKIMLGR